MQNKGLAFSYIRMSTEQQLKGDSLRRQLEATRAYADEKGLLLDDSLRDIGVSAWKGLNRQKGALARFLEMVSDGSVPRGSHLLVESLDRLSRDQVMQALKLFLEILEAGVIIHTLADRQVYSAGSVSVDLSQLIISLTVMARAHEESQRKSQRIREAFANKRRLSQSGAKTVSSPPSWITAKRLPDRTFQYELNERADVVRDIFQMSADGLGADRIARSLNERGVPTFRNSAKGWWPVTVQKLLVSRSAVGEYQPHTDEGGKSVPKGDPIADYFPPVVTADLFLRAQVIAHPNRKGGRAGTQFSNLLKDMCRCTRCGSPMYLRNNSRALTSQHYMVCASNMRGMGCTGNINFRYFQVEAAILDNVMEFGLSDLMRVRQLDEEARRLDEQIGIAVLALEDVTRKEKRLFDLYESGEDAALPNLLEVLRQRSQERQAADEHLKQLRVQRDTVMARQSALDPVSAIQEMREEWQTTEDAERRYALRARCNLAMREFIDQVDFDTVAGTYTVVLLGGALAYRFKNIKFARNVMHTAEMVDMIPMIQQGSHPAEAFTHVPGADGEARSKRLKRIG